MSARRLLIMPAAGTGSRLQSATPKALIDLDGIPMCQHTLRSVPDAEVCLVIHPQHEQAFRTALSDLPAAWTLRFQEAPTGMADAIAQTMDLWADYDQLVIAWADLVWPTAGPVAEFLEHARAAEQDMLVAAQQTRRPYVELHCDHAQRIMDISQAREGIEPSAWGLGDLGLFALRPALHDAFKAYLDDSSGIGAVTGERNFLPFLPYLARLGRPARAHVIEVEGPIAVNDPAQLEEARRQLASRSGCA